jgi:hypothetical protein
MDAFDFNDIEELDLHKSILSDGLRIFQNIWGYTSDSFIAPCYIWHSDLETTLRQHGVLYIQGLVNQLQPEVGDEYKFKKKYHYQGQRNNIGQRYFIRNAFFEPSINLSYDWESDCLNRIHIAFKMGKPAIISSHRLNYVGFLIPKNREQNIKRLRFLLKEIVKRWPDVLFLSTDQLGNLYKSEV